MIIKANTQNEPKVVKLQVRIVTIKASLAVRKKSLDDRYAALVVSDQVVTRSWKTSLSLALAMALLRVKSIFTLSLTARRWYYYTNRYC